MDRPFTLAPPAPRPGRRVHTAVGCGILLAAVVALFVAGLFIGDNAVAADFTQKGLPPSWQHPFGTDWLGRDMLLRTVKGLSVSITVGAVAALASAVVAIVMAALAAAGPRWLGGAVNWLIDLAMGVPHLVLLILIAFACGRGMGGLLLGIAVTHWMNLARLLRAEMLQLRGQPYVIISRRLGHSAAWVVRRHFLPHLLPQCIVGLVLLFPHAILHESALSFLGYGLPPEQPAIGIILSESLRYLTGGMWWLAVFPGVALVALVIVFDTLGNSLEKLLAPASAQD